LHALVGRLRYAAPHLGGHLRDALHATKAYAPRVRVDGIDWYWPAGEDPARASTDEHAGVVRLLAPFDPVVWDRRRFGLFWGWAYRFEAYTPVAKRKLGYYALPLLWQDDVIGWANVMVTQGALAAQVGYVRGHAPKGRAFARALDAELDRVRAFLAEMG
jgi:uncharacterized protein YcaQ